jgi:hypothetical protein
MSSSFYEIEIELVHPKCKGAQDGSVLRWSLRT